MASLSSVTLRTKLLISFLCVALLTLLIGIIGTTRIHKLDANDTKLYEKVTVPLGDISDVSTAFQRIRVNLLVATHAKDKAQLDDAVKSIAKFQGIITPAVESFGKTLLTDEGRKLYAEFLEARKDYDAIIEKVLSMAAAGQEAEATAFMQGDARKASSRYQDAIDKLMDIKTAQGKLFAAENSQDASSAAMLMYVIMAAAFLASVLLGLLLTRSIMDQLGEDPGYLAEVAGKIAGGDLHVVFKPQKKEGGVYHVIQGMVKTMKEKIVHAEEKTAHAAEQARLAEIATTEANEAKARAERAKAEGMMHAATQLEKVVEVVSSASEELSAQIEQSSRGTEVQSQRVGETATAMEEMNATVLEVAKNASQAAESSANARMKAVEGAKIVSQVVAGINTMQNVSLTMKEDMGVLGKQAEGIGQVMNVISDIADQTNLLALNAAIEAARAGDAGRGFAVVADEVRKLAEKTMVATKEVGEAISGIQHGTKKNLENVERAVSTVEEATGLAHQSGDALQEIVNLVEVATDQVRSIATASEEQSAASEEINKSIEEINRISTETATAMNQSAQAVGELANQAGNLRTLIEKMKSGE
ncbi:methyl-accepting chemotaxis protein [Humidesulfovibrio idahonensis]